MEKARAFTLQMFPWPTCLQAVKASVDYADFGAYYRELADSLPQNSPHTRARTASLIAKWCFPGRTLEALPTLVWRHYRQEDLLAETMRLTTLESEPVIAHFVVERIQQLTPGRELDVSMVRDYIVDAYGRFNAKSYARLLNTCRHLGFLSRQNGTWSIGAVAPPRDAFLIVLHARLAPSPRIVRLSDILASMFWRYLGFRSPDEIRIVLRDAESAGLISRYAVVDELEQVTTRYSWAEYLQGSLQL